MHFSSRIFFAQFQNLVIKRYIVKLATVTGLRENDKFGPNVISIKKLPNSVILPPNNC